MKEQGFASYLPALMLGVKLTHSVAKIFLPCYYEDLEILTHTEGGRDHSAFL